MNILKKLFRHFFNLCPECGCPMNDYSSKKSFCPCGCDLSPVTKEAEERLNKYTKKGGKT